ncbi:MAG: COR domain-containing protein, partial [Cyanobacteria bacterium P01_D01_bin.36]
IAQLSNLTTLYLNSNQITEIPEAIAQLSNLTTLYLFSNQITEIPEAIAQLSNLTTLYLDSNQITEIPEAIAQLSNLTELYLESNKIEEVPASLAQLPKLKKLDLRKNRLSISPEILGPNDVSQAPGSPEQIFRYLHEMNSGTKRQLNEAKLLLVGQGSVGKTSLIKQLIHNCYDPNESQTDGLNVTEWPLAVNGKPIRLNVWDFGGQEIYHATHQFFLTKRSLYILTCNCRTSEDENRLEYWLKLIQSFGGSSPVIIVGNKSDEQPLDINRKALKEKYPNIKAILETSCATGQGIQDLRAKITYEVSQLTDVYNLLPLTWFEVKESLEEMEQDFIPYDDYACLCHDKNVTNSQSKEQLIELLHNLGLVLNFRNHPILKDTNVLNPDWVTTGIYTLLSDETLKTKTKGILCETDLTRILDSGRYPSKRHPYLTELIQEFQLGFPLANSQANSQFNSQPNSQPKTFLLPSILPKEEPEDIELEGNTLEFQYHYRILPESILSRFIVLNHEDIHNQTYWRTGVMLHYTEGEEIYNIARVKADPEDKKIFITISGKDATRRPFLTMLRKTFHKIHSSFSNLEVTERVPVPGYPDHPPLRYKEMLGLEKMNVQDYPIGELGTTVNVRQLLNGYETPEARQQRRYAELGKDGMRLEEHMLDGLKSPSGDIHLHLTQTQNAIQNQGDNKPVSNTVNQYGQGDKYAGDNVHGDKIGTQINNSQDLAQATCDIKALFAELDQTYDKTTPIGQMTIATETVKAIEGNPTVKKRLINALKEGGTTALEEAIEHPAIKPVVAAIKGYIDA